MSPSTVRARLVFSFRGETHTLDSVIDLERSTTEPGEVPDFHLLLAQSAGIDPYSYQYEVMTSHEIEFSQATGAAVASCSEGRFDWTRFERDRSDAQDWPAVQAVMEKIGAVPERDIGPEWKAALLAIYRAGRARGR